MIQIHYYMDLFMLLFDNKKKLQYTIIKNRVEGGPFYMAKVSFLKLGLKRNTNVITLNWNDQVIEIKEYLPIVQKSEVVQTIIQESLDDNSFANPIKIKINLVLEVIFAYTNINFTDKQKEDRLALYDILIGSGLWAAVKNLMDNYTDLSTIETDVNVTIAELNRHKDSILGVLEAVNQDYSNLQLDVNALTEPLTDPNSLALLKTIATKLD